MEYYTDFVRLRDLRRFFMAPHLRDWGTYGVDQYIEKWAIEFNVSTPKEVFEIAFRHLQVNYPDEYVLKNALLTWKRELGNTDYLRTEAWMTETRLDVMAVSKVSSTAYEIKSRFDSTHRLARQIKAYSEVFEFVVLVCESEHSSKFLNHVPRYVGLTVVNSDGTIEVERPPTKHMKNLNRYQMLNQMLKAERIDFIKRNRPSQKYVVGSNYKYTSFEIAKEMSLETVSEELRYQVHKRTKPLRHLRFLFDLPPCFTAALYDYFLPVAVLKGLVKLMDKPIQQSLDS